MVGRGVHRALPVGSCIDRLFGRFSPGTSPGASRDLSGIDFKIDDPGSALQAYRPGCAWLFRCKPDREANLLSRTAHKEKDLNNFRETDLHYSNKYAGCAHTKR